MTPRLLACLAFVGSIVTIPPPAPAADPVPVATERGARQPQVAVDGKGGVHVAYGAGGAIRCATSRDGGLTFTSAEVGGAKALSLGMRRGPRIASAGDSLVITAIGGELGGGKDGDVLAWRSADDGRTWTGPTRVNTVSGSAREGLHAMAAAPDGSVFCAWLDLRAKGTEIYGARSRDGGATWEPDALVYRSPDKSVCQCCHPSVAYAPDGAVLVMWRNLLKGARDMYLARSADGGKTFSAAEKLGRGTWPLNACPMDGGAVAVGPDGNVETVWMRAGSMFAASPGEPETPLGAGVQGWTATGEAGPYRVWLGARGGPLLATTPGANTPKTLAKDARDPVVAAGPKGRGPIVAAWELTGPEGGIVLQRLDRAGSGR